MNDEEYLGIYNLRIELTKFVKIIFGTQAFINLSHERETNKYYVYFINCGKIPELVIIKENIKQCVENVCLIAIKENKNILSDIDEQIQFFHYRKNEIKKILLLL